MIALDAAAIEIEIVSTKSTISAPITGKRPGGAERASRRLGVAPALREAAHEEPVVDRHQDDDADHDRHRREQVLEVPVQ